jgi:hypothetical protein
MIESLGVGARGDFRHNTAKGRVILGLSDHDI